MLDDLGYPYDLGHHPKIGVLKKLATSLVRPYAIRFFFCSSFFSHSGHVPKHNHLCFFFCSSFFSHMAMCPNTIISLSLSRSGTVQNNVSEGSPKIWRIQMNPIYPRFCSFKQLTHFRPCVHHKSRITC